MLPYKDPCTLDSGVQLKLAASMGQAQVRTVICSNLFHASPPWPLYMPFDAGHCLGHVQIPVEDVKTPDDLGVVQVSQPQEPWHLCGRREYSAP